MLIHHAFDLIARWHLLTTLHHYINVFFLLILIVYSNIFSIFLQRIPFYYYHHHYYYNYYHHQHLLYNIIQIIIIVTTTRNLRPIKYNHEKQFFLFLMSMFSHGKTHWTAIKLYRYAKCNHVNYKLIEYSDAVNTFLLLLMKKDLRFCCYENYYFFWLYIQISCVSRSSTTLCLSYYSFGSSCKITAIVGLFERLLRNCC